MQWFGLEHTLQVISLLKACLHHVSGKGGAQPELSCSCPWAGAVVGGSGDTAQGQDVLLVPSEPWHLAGLFVINLLRFSLISLPAFSLANAPL